MRLVCNSAALNEGLQIASRAMSTRTANPILEGVLLEARMGQLRITTSDERLTILTRVECEVAEAGRGVSRHMLDNKRTLSLRRKEMAQEVFALVRAKIAAFTRTDAYTRRMAALMTEAAGYLAGAKEVLVTLREEDMGLRQILTDAVPLMHLTFQPGDFRMGGLVAESPDLGLRVDASFDSAAEELSGHFAELFGLSLSDESERTVLPE